MIGCDDRCYEIINVLRLLVRTHQKKHSFVCKSKQNRDKNSQRTRRKTKNEGIERTEGQEKQGQEKEKKVPNNKRDNNTCEFLYCTTNLQPVSR